MNYENIFFFISWTDMHKNPLISFDKDSSCTTSRERGGADQASWDKIPILSEQIVQLHTDLATKKFMLLRYVFSFLSFHNYFFKIYLFFPEEAPAVGIEFIFAFIFLPTVNPFTFTSTNLSSLSSTEPTNKSKLKRSCKIILINFCTTNPRTWFIVFSVRGLWYIYLTPEREFVSQFNSNSIPCSRSAAFTAANK